MKRYKPTTPSRRHMTTVSYKGVLTESEPRKSLTSGLSKRAGRGRGRISTRHKGGGSKRLFRKIDFKYNKRDIPAKIESVEYDPNRSGFIGLVLYRDGERKYVLLPSSLKVGDKMIVSEKADISAGNRLPLKKVPIGTFVYNVEIKPDGGAKIARSAGNYAELIALEGGHAQLKMPSNEIRKVNENAWASVGAVSNEEHKLVNIGKAGRNRKMGKRPTVRGSAMNPVDHPYGGGEGRSPQGTKRPKNKWGKGTRGVKTRRVKKYSNIFIISRRKKKKK